MSALKESSAALSAGRQLPLDLPSITEEVVAVAAARMARKRKLDAAMALLLRVCARMDEGTLKENMVVAQFLRTV